MAIPMQAVVLLVSIITVGSVITLSGAVHAPQVVEVWQSAAAIAEAEGGQSAPDQQPDAQDNEACDETSSECGLTTPQEECTQDTPSASTSPNIVLMLVDDLGYGDLGISGHPTSHTPAIDALATQSKQMTHFYVTSPVCSPSRASLLTGRYHVRSGVYPGTFVPEGTHGLPLNETTIAEMLKEQDYRTMISGKWHLGVGVDNEFLPTNQGFDDFLGLPYSHDMCPCGDCFPDEGPCYDTCWDDRVSCPIYNNNSITAQPVPLPGLSQRLVQQATAFMADSVQQDRPFFLYLAFQHVHHPQFSSPVHVDESIRGTFGDSLLELDAGVDRVMNQLRELGVINHTIVWFMSDNGPSMKRQERGGCAGPLRCGKGTTWEGGVRVPSFVSWPGVIQPERTEALLSSLDILPTLATFTHSSLPAATLDGFDISSLLTGTNQESPREFFAVYPEKPREEEGPYAVVWGRYKAHYYTKGSDLSDNSNYDSMCTEAHPVTLHDPPLLYDLFVDPGERWDIANRTGHRATLELMGAWRAAHMAAMTWQQPFTSLTDWRAQPCCGDSQCEPYPACCDCTQT